MSEAQRSLLYLAIDQLRSRINEWGSDDLDDDKAGQLFATIDVVDACRKVIEIAEGNGP